MIGGGGSNTVQSHDMSTGEDLAGVTPFPIDGSMPPFAAKTPFRPDAPCENQDPPNLAATGGPAPPQPDSAPAGAAPAPGSAAAPLVDDATTTLKGLGEAAQAKDDGEGSKARKLQKQAMKDLARLLRRLRHRRRRMSVAIRKHLRDFIAIALLLRRRRSRPRT